MDISSQNALQKVLRLFNKNLSNPLHKEKNICYNIGVVREMEKTPNPRPTKQQRRKTK